MDKISYADMQSPASEGDAKLSLCQKDRYLLGPPTNTVTEPIHHKQVSAPLPTKKNVENNLVLKKKN